MSNDSDSIIEKHLARVQRMADAGELGDEDAPAKAAGHPGSKAAGGVAERIIGQMPPHNVYVEAFAGHAAVFRLKRPAERSLLIDSNTEVCDWLKAHIAGVAGVHVECRNAIEWLKAIRWSVRRDWLIYLDPPYLLSTRTGKLYEDELLSEGEHTELLDAIRVLECGVMISGYDSWLYSSMLQDWRVVDIPAMTRGGKRLERLWCNFEVPELLHDPRYAGNDYRERENYARRAKRWAAKFLAMDRRERQQVAVALATCDRLAVEMALFTLPAKAAVPDPTDTPADNAGVTDRLADEGQPKKRQKGKRT